MMEFILQLCAVALCCVVVPVAVGAYLHVLWKVGGFLTTVASLGSIVWLLSTLPYEEAKNKAVLLMVFFLSGSFGGTAQRVPLSWWFSFFWILHSSVVALRYLWG